MSKCRAKLYWLGGSAEFELNYTVEEANNRYIKALKSKDRGYTVESDLMTSTYNLNHIVAAEFKPLETTTEVTT